MRGREGHAIAENSAKEKSCLEEQEGPEPTVEPTCTSLTNNAKKKNTNPSANDGDFQKHRKSHTSTGLLVLIRGATKKKRGASKPEKRKVA